MNLKKTWNKAKEKVKDSVFAYFAPHELYQKEGGWSFHNTKRKFNQMSQDDREKFIMLGAMFGLAANPQPAYVRPAPDLTYDV